MISDSKKIYLEKIDSSFPIFFQPWWLDIVANGKWDVYLVNDSNKNILAAMPVTFNENETSILMPPLTLFLGAIFLPSIKTKYYEILSYQMLLTEELIKQIKKINYYEQRWSVKFTNWLPLFWLGFNQTTKYTYIIKNISNINIVEKNFMYNVKKNINKAKKNIIIKSIHDTLLFYNLLEKTFKRQGLKTPYSYELINQLILTSINKNQGELFFAVDNDNCLHSTLFFVWDSESAYLIAAGNDDKYRNSEAPSLLYWETIKFLSGKTKSVNFCASMIKPIEKFIRAFGAEQTQYFEIKKYNSKLAKLKQAFKMLKNAIYS